MLPRVTISIPGTPRGKQRPRSGPGGFYTPKETEAEEAYVRSLAIKAMAGRAPSTGPIMLTLEAIFEMPASWPSRVREMRQLPHVSKPDLDNIEKLILDAFNGVVFLDDGQVCEVRKCKRYGEGERVDVVLEEMATTVDHPAVRRAVKRAADEDRIEPRGARNRRKQPRRAAPAIKVAPIGKRLK